MATLAEVRTEVRARIDEQQARYWTDPDLNVWIYEAARDIARRAEILQGARSYDVQADQRSYTVPEDMVRIHRVEFRTSTDRGYFLEFVPFNEIETRWFTGSGVGPSMWTMWGTPGIQGNQIEVYPVPSSDYAQGLTIYYYRLPTRPVQDTDPVEVPAGWEDLVSVYVEYSALRRAGSPRWRDALDLYNSQMESMLNVTRHWSDQQSHITASDLYPTWVGAWDW